MQMKRKLDPIPPGEILLEEFMKPLGLSSARARSAARWMSRPTASATSFVRAGRSRRTPRFGSRVTSALRRSSG
jgi:plasmid maintenance system antidote protein VapI